jgi:hypothetical protein
MLETGETSQTDNSNPEPEGRPCACGCGTIVRRKFAPGHDQRFVSNLAKAVAEGNMDRKTALAAARKLSPALEKKVRSAVNHQ